MKDLLVKVLLAIIVIILVAQNINSCSRNSKIDGFYKKQNKKLDSLSVDLNKQIKARVDTILIKDHKLTIIEKEKMSAQNEVYNLTNSDSILKRYYYYRPIKADNTVR